MCDTALEKVYVHCMQTTQVKLVEREHHRTGAFLKLSAGGLDVYHTPSRNSVARQVEHTASISHAPVAFMLQSKPRHNCSPTYNTHNTAGYTQALGSSMLTITVTEQHESRGSEGEESGTQGYKRHRGNQSRSGRAAATAHEPAWARS